MAHIYLIIDKGNKLAKVGYSSNLASRVILYGGHNPMAVIVDHCATYKTSRRTVEMTAQQQLRALGGVPVVAEMTHTVTEWHAFPNNPEVLDKLTTEGLEALGLGKRKYKGIFTL